MAKQTALGKMFEYACLNAIEDTYIGMQPITVVQNSALETARGYYEEANQVNRDKMDKAAVAATRALIKLEPQLDNGNDTQLILKLQSDRAGETGDVRDVLCIRNDSNWEIGLSCKHNHAAVKHSRLSQTIDFGTKWFGKPCSCEYFKQIEPVFAELARLREEGANWRELENKETRFYVPVLNAFIAELKSLDSKYPGEIPKAMLIYLLGNEDFYKVITNDSKKTTEIQAYNLFGTLNMPCNGVKPQVTVRSLKLAERFYDIRYKENSKNTVIVTCDNGWAISFRIHNARTSVEPSLKFDVNLVGIPPSLHKQIEAWSV